MHKHIVITGASSGVGRALAIKLSTLGYQLSLCGLKKDKLAQTLAELAVDSAFYAQSFCLSDQGAIANFIANATDKFGDVDVLVNCAGLNSSRASAATPDWQALNWMLTINFFAPLRFIEVLMPSMLQAKKGTILNVLSTTCLYANKNIAAYSASKSAFDSYTKVLRKELHNTGIKVLSLYPGGINSDFRANENHQYLTASEVADAILAMLSSQHNTHIHELVIRPEIENNFS